MRYPLHLLLIIGVLFSFHLCAQDSTRLPLLLKTGTVYPVDNLSEQSLASFNQLAKKVAGKSIAIIQFETLPSEAVKKQLEQQGIILLDYIPENAYTVTVSSSLSETVLRKAGVRSLVNLSAAQKMQPEIAAGNFPSWATTIPGTIDVWVSFAKTFSLSEVKENLAALALPVLSADYQQYRILSLRVPVQRLGELSLLPFIEYVQAVPASDQLLNYNSMYASKANLIRLPIAAGGYNLNGDGVVVGEGDNGDVQSHIDLVGKLISRVAEVPLAHATHVAGTIAGKGLIQEIYAGYAPKAQIISQSFSNILKYSPTYVQDYGMVVTNNSYGSVTNDCAYNGLYDLTARILDQQAFDLPELQHVFAAGNDGDKTCLPYSKSFKTVLGGYQSAKNVFTIGSTDYKRDWSNFSSRGPVKDGRLKPEIMSQGTFVASTWTNNQYSYNNGTSMAAPGVTGGWVLLTQRFRQLNAGANPKAGLMKAIMCNGAADRGNVHPDFSYGFGSMDLWRSIKIIDNASYFSGTVAPAATNTHSINVPAGAAQLKILLYWQDPPASVMATKTLVNDLDLQTVTPSLSTVLPFVLDTTGVNLNNVATTGVDHLNNIEQITIDNPAAGNYDLKVIGTAITQNPTQAYFLVYDIVPYEFKLFNPVGNEPLIPTISTYKIDTVYIQWEDNNTPAVPYTLEFSSNDGATWSMLNNNIPATKRVYSWAVPTGIATDVARIRLTKNTTAFTQTSNAFTITDWATVALSPIQCEGYIKIEWPAVTGATDYEVFKLKDEEMQSVGTTTALEYTFSGLAKDSTYYVTIRPRINGKPGRRAAAVWRQPSSGSCVGNISDNDLKMDSIVSPLSSGRLFTSTSLSAATPVTIRIRNLDDAVSAGDITVSYTLNGGTPVVETITAPTSAIPVTGFIDYTFTSTIDLSAIGSYQLEINVTKATDPVVANNVLTKTFRQLNNAPITAASIPWIDNMESITEQSVFQRQLGLNGSDRYDFVPETAWGRLRSFINSGLAYSGTKALTLDTWMGLTFNNIDSLTATFNLATFNAAVDEMRLDFRYKNHGQRANAANKVWIRGSDTDSWIEMYNLFANQNPTDGSYKLTSSLEIADSLIIHSQSFSSSFQFRIGQWGQYMAADNDGGAGYSIDDIRIYKAVDDIRLQSIDAPVATTCNASITTPVTVSVRNTSAAAVTNVPIVLKVDGSIVATELIPLINANALLAYTFSPGSANLSAAGNHTIEVWVNYASDNVRDNDSSKISIKTLPLISSFPYLENFEATNGNWYTENTGNSSWQYGVPLSVKINQAASGSKAWKTNLNGYYNDGELSYLYSPCYNLSGMASPTLSFHLALDVEDCGATLCDAAWMEYSDDGGVTWKRLGAMGAGTNWYNKTYAGNDVWSQQDYTRWHVATSALPSVNNSSLRLRFVFNSDGGLNKDGIAIDDIHIYDNLNGIYDITGASPVVTQASVSGTGWVQFVEGGTNKIIASINPNGQTMGNTDVQSFINAGTVRNINNQYYHDRNITIKPTTTALTDSATVRFYFLDAETEALINATGCTTCYKPSMAKQLGVTKYSDADDSKENGTLADNLIGNYLFITAPNVIKVPYDKGYYAEFKVKNFSEFWLNIGGFNLLTPLPVQLLNFTARKEALGNNVLVEWRTNDEDNASSFEIEVATSEAALQQGLFSKIGWQAAKGTVNTTNNYSFIDSSDLKSGVYYYRLKMIDQDGKFTYSAVRPVVFSSTYIWAVTPNPSTGNFKLQFQAVTGEKLQFTIYDVQGKLVKQQMAMATGFVQQFGIDLTEGIFASGTYLLKINGVSDSKMFKLIKR